MAEYVFETHRVEWLCEVYAVDQYDQRQQGAEVYYSAAHPTRELAEADRERVAVPHAYVWGRWTSVLCPHQYHEVCVRQHRVLVSTRTGEQQWTP